MFLNASVVVTPKKKWFLSVGQREIEGFHHPIQKNNNRKSKNWTYCVVEKLFATDYVLSKNSFIYMRKKKRM